MKPYIIGIDPSGSFKEGKGTTGIATLNPKGLLEEHGIVEASGCKSQTEYWELVIEAINLRYDVIKQLGEVVLSVEDYVLYASSAKAQINSEMETSKLIGAITMWAHTMEIPIYLRSASQVMNRWPNNILEYKKIIFKKGNRYTDQHGNYINKHSLDAIRHAVHCHYFELKEVTDEAK